MRERSIGYPALTLPEWVRPPFQPGTPFACTEAARQFHRSTDRIKAMIGGLGSSKTVTLCAEGIFAGFANLGCVGALFEPTFPLVRDVLKPSLEQRLEAFGLRRGRDWTLNTTEWAWRVLGGADRGGFTILGRAAGRDSFERIIGLNLGWAGLDEPAECPREALAMIRTRVRDPRARAPRVFMTGTPNPGTWVSAWIRNPSEGARIITASTDGNPWIEQAYLDSLTEDFDPKALEAYRHGKAVSLTGNAYHAFHKADWPDGNLQRITYDPTRPVILSLDNNRDPLCAGLWQQDGKHVDEFAEVTLRGGSWGALAEAVHQRMGGRAPAGLTLCGDAVLRGTIRDEESDWGGYQSVAEQLGRLFPGLRCQLRVPKANPLVVTRLETHNRLLVNAKCERRMRIDPSCKEMILDLEEVALDKDGGLDKRSDKARTHHADHAGYLACALFPMTFGSSRRPGVMVSGKMWEE